MNQNNIMVRLISFKEQLNTFFEKRGRVAKPVIQGVIALAALLLITRIFPYKGVLNYLPVIVCLAAAQAFLPMSLLYYIASAVILCNLWKVSFDLFAAFLVLMILTVIAYFRIDARYSYLAIITFVLFYLKLEIVIPAAIALLFGMGALVPVLVGILIYYFSFSLSDTYTMLTASDAAVGIGVQKVLSNLIGNQQFFVVLASVLITFVISCFLRRLFYERAWLVAVITGNVIMAVCLFVGRLYFEVTIPIWRILLETVLGILICSAIEFFRGIGDVSRVEKTVFEDDEYIYYVKAVPKMKLAVSEPNVKIMNDSVESPSESTEESGKTTEDVSADAQESEGETAAEETEISEAENAGEDVAGSEAENVPEDTDSSEAEKKADDLKESETENTQTKGV